MKLVMGTLQAMTLMCLILGGQGSAFSQASGPADKKEKEETAEISGVVALNGKPVESGTILFLPEDKGKPSMGAAIKNGAYFLKGGPGKMTVSISVPKAVKAAKDGKEEVVVESLPEKFNAKSALRVEVRPGKNTFDFQLRTK